MQRFGWMKWLMTGVAAMVLAACGGGGGDPVSLSQRIVAFYDNAHGVEPWTTDGTASNTKMLKDINMISAKSNYENYIEVSDKIFFTSTTDSLWGAVQSLWVKEQAEENARKVLQFPAGHVINTHHDGQLVAADSYLYYLVSKEFGGDIVELWKTNGTVNGTTLLKTIDRRINDTSISGLSVLGDKVYFLTGSYLHDMILWTVDGESVSIVKNIYLGHDSGGSYIVSLSVAGDKLFFTGYDADHGMEPWVSDGTSGGTKMLTDVVFGPRDSYPSAYMEHDGKVYYVVYTGGNRQIHVHDGVTDSLYFDTESSASVETLFWHQGALHYLNSGSKIMKISGGPLSATWVNGGYTGWGQIEKVLSNGDKLYYSTVAYAMMGPNLYTLWLMDDTGDTELSEHLSDENIVLYAGKAYFGATDGFYAAEGSDITQINSRHSAALASYSDKLYVTGYAESGNSPYISDGTDFGTTKIAAATGTGASYGGMQVFSKDGFSYFTARREVGSSRLIELWKTDGTAGGTVKLASLEGYNPNPELHFYDDDIYLTGEKYSHDPFGGMEPPERVLLKYSTSDENLSILAKKQSYADFSNFIVHDGYLYLTAGRTILRINADANGTEEVLPDGEGVCRGGNPSFQDIVEINGTIYFSNQECKLSSLDTTASVVPLAQTPTAAADVLSGIKKIVKAGTKLRIFRKNAEAKYELWTFDPVEDSLSKLADMDKDSMIETVVTGDMQYFVTTDEDESIKLWFSDGIAEHTEMIAILNTHSRYEKFELTMIGDRLYFVNTDSEHGKEVWTSDGTAGGTVMISDNYLENSTSIHIALYGELNGKLLFVMDGKGGPEMWITDAEESSKIVP